MKIVNFLKKLYQNLFRYLMIFYDKINKFLNFLLKNYLCKCGYYKNEEEI